MLSSTVRSRGQTTATPSSHKRMSNSRRVIRLSVFAFSAFVAAMVHQALIRHHKLNTRVRILLAPPPRSLPSSVLYAWIHEWRAFVSQQLRLWTPAPPAHQAPDYRLAPVCVVITTTATWRHAKIIKSTSNSARQRMTSHVNKQRKRRTGSAFLAEVRSNASFFFFICSGCVLLSIRINYNIRTRRKLGVSLKGWSCQLRVTSYPAEALMEIYLDGSTWIKVSVYFEIFVVTNCIRIPGIKQFFGTTWQTQVIALTRLDTGECSDVTIRKLVKVYKSDLGAGFWESVSRVFMSWP